MSLIFIPISLIFTYVLTQNDFHQLRALDLWNTFHSFFFFFLTMIIILKKKTLKQWAERQTLPSLGMMVLLPLQKQHFHVEHQWQPSESKIGWPYCHQTVPSPGNLSASLMSVHMILKHPTHKGEK